MTVVLVDLRTATADVAGDRMRAALPAQTTAKPVRMLVLDDAAALAGRYELFGRLLGSRRVAALICVAIGPVDSGQPGAAVLRVSAVLDNDASATLWVGDEHGTLWGTDRSGLPNPDTEAEETGLDQLVRCLAADDVFDRVLAEIGSIPNRTASPGLRVSTGQLATPDLRLAVAAAIRRLVGQVPDEAVDQLPGVDATELTPLLGSGVVPGGRHPVHPDGPLDQLRRAADTALRTAEERLRRLGGLTGLLFGSGRRATAGRPLAHTADCVERYHRAVAEAFDRGDAIGRIDGRQGAELERYGLAVAVPPGFDRSAVLNRLQPVVDAALARYPLNTVIDWLRVLSERAAPAGSASFRERLDGLHRATLRSRLADPPPFPLARADPRVLSAVVVCCLLAGIGPVGLLPGIIVGLSWTIAAWFTYARIPTPDGNRGVRRALGPHLLLQAAAATAGVAAGRFAATQLSLPAGAGLPAIVVAVVGLAVVLHLWWSAAASAWTAELGLSGVRTAIADHDRLLVEVAVHEWALADARTYLADATRVVAGGLADIVEVLEERLKPDADEHGTASRGGLAPDSEDALETLLAGDLGAAVRAVLRGCWDRLRTGARAQVQGGLAGEMRSLLGSFDEHLAQHHVFEPPPFAGSEDTGDRRLDLMLGPPARLAGLLAASPGEPFVQLCTTADLGMLDAAPQSARMVRFAPDFVREPVTAVAANGSATDLGDVQWTTSGHLAGVLRLMPMRPGVVVREWASQGGAKELS